MKLTSNLNRILKVLTLKRNNKEKKKRDFEQKQRREQRKVYDVLLIARYVIARCNERGFSISNLKLQKMLYFVQAEMLVARGRPCFRGTIEAWDFGPVAPQVYRKYKVYGSGSIPYVGKDRFDEIASADREIIDRIVDECGPYSAAALVEITHNQDPWREAYRPGCSRPIENESIRSYFLEG